MNYESFASIELLHRERERLKSDLLFLDHGEHADATITVVGRHGEVVTITMSPPVLSQIAAARTLISVRLTACEREIARRGTPPDRGAPAAAE